MVLAGVLVAAQGMARVPMIPVDPAEGESVLADAIAPVLPDGTIGAWQNPNQTGALGPIWSMAWDSMSANPTNFTPFSGNPYGTSPGPRRPFRDDYRIFQWCEDLVLVPGTEQRFGRFVRVGIFWNPNGSIPASGSRSCFLRVQTAARFDDTSFGPAADEIYSGVVARFTNLAAGVNYLTIDLGNANTGLPLPRSGGALLVSLGGVNSNNAFVPLEDPAAATPLFSNMLSPGEPQFPGTNPSRSGDLQWLDDSDPLLPGVNQSNYILEDFTNTQLTGNPFAELYSGDATFNNQGILQTAATVVADTDVVTISGRVTLGDLAAGSRRPGAVSVRFTNRVGGAVIGSQVVSLDSQGNFTALDPQQGNGGDYRLILKVSHWLAGSVNANTTGRVSRTGANVALVNGDIDGDNAVTVFDYIALSQAFGVRDFEPTWLLPGEGDLRPRDSDLDEDGEVSVFDYIILSVNFDSIGSE